jgi:MFS family permease
MLILSVGFIDGLLLYGLNVFFPVEVESLFTNNLLLAGVYLLPMNVTVLLGCFLSAWFLQKTRRYRSVLVISLLMIAVFLGLLALVTPSRLAMACVFTGFVGLGVGATTVLPPTILSYSIPSHLL